MCPNHQLKRHWVNFLVFPLLVLLCFFTVYAADNILSAKSVFYAESYDSVIKSKLIQECTNTTYFEYPEYNFPYEYDCVGSKNQTTMIKEGICLMYVQKVVPEKHYSIACKEVGVKPDLSTVEIPYIHDNQACLRTDDTICCWDRRDGYSEYRGLEFRKVCRSGESCTCWNLKTLKVVSDSKTDYDSITITKPLVRLSDKTVSVSQAMLDVGDTAR